jgi:hypothetical protein
MGNDKLRREQPDVGLAAEMRPVPSQAEGEDEEVSVKDTSPGAGFRPCPSQAEGDLETIEADLKRGRGAPSRARSRK